jgi:hypothetical protein
MDYLLSNSPAIKFTQQPKTFSLRLTFDCWQHFGQLPKSHNFPPGSLTVSAWEKNAATLMG